MSTVLSVNATIGFSENLFLVFNNFKDKCRYILHYLSATNLNLLSCHSCISDQYAKFTHSLMRETPVAILSYGTAGVPPVNRVCVLPYIYRAVRYCQI